MAARSQTDRRRGLYLCLLDAGELLDDSAAGGYLLGTLGGSHKWVQELGAGQRNIAVARAKGARRRKEEEAKSRQQKVRSRE